MENPAPTPAPPDTPSRPMRFLQRWIRVKIDSQVTIYLSLFAIIVSCVLSVWSLWQDNSQNVKQRNFDLTLAAFEVDTQATAAYQVQQQINIQNTQVAMQSQMDAWYRQQALPLVNVVIPPEHIFVVNKVFAEQSSSGYVITGEGQLEMVLANNGGGKAGMVNVNWVNEAQNDIVLRTRLDQIGNSPVELPSTIDAQTPVKVQLALEASVPFGDDPQGKSDYQLGTYWKAQLISDPNHLAILFSNADPIVVNIKDIQLAMPESAYQPIPISLFPVTNKTPVTVRCFKTGGKDIPIKITYLNREQEIQTTISDDSCNSFPVGSYKIIIRNNSTQIEDHITITFSPDGTSLINLTNPDINIFSRIKDWGVNYISILTTVLAGLASATLMFFQTRTKGLVQLQDSTNTLFFSKSIRLFPWGGTVKFRIQNEDVMVKIRKHSRNKYHLKIYRDGARHRPGREVTLTNNQLFTFGSIEDGELQIVLRNFDHEESDE